MYFDSASIGVKILLLDVSTAGTPTRIHCTFGLATALEAGFVYNFVESSLLEGVSHSTANLTLINVLAVANTILSLREVTAAEL